MAPLLRFDPKYEFSLQVCVYFDYLSVSEVDEYPEVVLVEYLRGLDVRFDFSKVEMRVANIFDPQPWRRKTEVQIDVEIVHQPISVGLDTVARILVDLCRQTYRELFCRDCELNEVENLRLASESKGE